MTEAARLAVVVDSDTRPLERGLSAASSKLKVFGADVGALGNVMSTALTAGALAGAAGIAAGFAGAISSAAGFEARMSGVKAVSGATAEEMGRLSGLALQLGKDTSFSASQAAAGIEELVKGGLSIPDIMNGAAKSTLALAAAGGVSLPEAATIAANALAQFNLKGKDMAHVADLIAGAANASALDVGQFKFSLQAAGAVAATVGFNFDDLAQAIAVMGKAGVVGSDAGTSLKTMMLNLQPSTKAAKAEMRDLGLLTKEGGNAFFDAQGKVKSMTEVAGILHNATKNLTEAQRLQKLETIFGSDAIRAAAILAKAGAEGFTEMAGAMGKVTAESVGAERLNNLRGDLEQLKGSVETAAIVLGTALLPVLRGFAQTLTQTVNAMIPLAEQHGPKLVAGLAAIGAVLATLSGSFSTLQQWMQDNALVMSAVTGALVAMAGAFVVVRAVQLAAAAATAVMTIAQYALNLAMSVNPIMLVVVALGALVGALVYAYQTNEDFRKVVDEVFAFLQRVVREVLNEASRRFEAFVVVVRWVGDRLVELQGTASRVFGALSSIATAAWKLISEVTREAWDFLSPYLERVWSSMQTRFETVMQGIRFVVDVAWPAIRSVIEQAMEAASQAVSTRLDAIQRFFATARDVITSIVNTIRDVVSSIFGEVERRANDAIGVVRGALDTVNNLLDQIRGAINAARDLVSSAPGVPAPPEAPSMPGGDGGGGDVAPTEAYTASRYAIGAATQTVVHQIILPGGVYYGALTDLASALQPELDRRVTSVR